MENNSMCETKSLLRDLCDADCTTGQILREWLTIETILYMEERIKKAAQR